MPDLKGIETIIIITVRSKDGVEGSLDSLEISKAVIIHSDGYRVQSK